MANTKISDFTSGAPAQATDEFVIARGGANYKLAGSDIKTLAVGAGAVSVTSAKTLTVSNTLTLAGTDGSTMTFPSTSATLARTDAGNTFTGSQTLTGGTITADSPVLGTTQTWNAGAVTFTGWKLNVTDTASASGSLLMDLQVGGSSKFKISKAGEVTVPSAGYFAVAGGNSIITQTYIRSIDFAVESDSGVIRMGGAGDVRLTRRAAANLRLGAADAAAPVAQTLSVQSVVAGTTNTAGANLTITGSQGTGTGAGGSIVFQVAPAGSTGSAQNSLVTFLEATSARAFNLYNTADVTTNYERGKIAWSSNVLQIGTEKAGTGTARALALQTDGTTRVTIPSSGGDIITASDSLNIQRGAGGGDYGQLVFGNTNAGSYGLITSNYVRIRNRAGTSGAFIEMIEQTAPAAPAANEVRIYAEDNGSGKTRLMALFATGAAVQIAIEP